MELLTDITVDDLQQALDTTDEKTPALRLLAAIAYKNGNMQSELAEGFNIERKTIYNWLYRLEKGISNLLYWMKTDREDRENSPASS